ncbi:MAG: tetraacyldisaccharide 4'-kinase [Desulfobacula sp.]|nr:tetraacyldisaccharide 4'-kinase [Desulfobacula sp.]
MALFDTYLNRLEKKITRISDQEYTPDFFSFEQVLVAASGLYQLGSKLRLRLYRSGLLTSRRLPCFVISIGNIMAGGVGKTPMAIHIAELLMKMGKRPVVISRGYKGSLGPGPRIVSDGSTLFLDAEKAGDEPYMMARRKRFPVVVGKNRYLAGKLAVEQLNPNVIVLDDAFSHLGLERDLDILLFDHDRPLGNNRILPAGRLRETPAMSKERAQAIILTRCPGKKETEDQGADPGGHETSLRQEKRFGPYGEIPFFKTSHSPFLLQLLPREKKSGQALGTPETLKDRPGLLFSGIAKNDSFRSAAEEMGVNVVDHLEFKDHYMYKRADILWIQERARQIGADLIVTTEKDWVKLDRTFRWERDLAVIGIKIRFENEKAFEGFIRSRLNE